MTQNDTLSQAGHLGPAVASRTPLVGGPRGLRRRLHWPVLVLVGLAILATVNIFTLPTREGVGLAAVALMLVLMFMKMPIAFALMISGVVGLFSVSGFRAVESVTASTPMSATASWSLSVLPMFILMGMLLAASGSTTRVYNAARLWLGWVPGGLAFGTNVAGAGLAAVSGSTIANSYALGRIGIPEMLRAGYDRRLAVGSVIVAGLPGQVIPPSTFLIIVAGITGAAVGPQLIAGIVPGLLMSILLGITILLLAILWPALVGKGRRAKASQSEHDVQTTWRERFSSLGGVWPLAVLFLAIFGGMFGGVLTATEAGAVGAFVALLITWWFQRKNHPVSHIVKGAVDAVTTVGAIFLVLLGAHVLTNMIAVTGLGRAFSDIILSLGFGRVEFLLVLMVGYIILGMFMDPLSMLLLTVPILLPSLDTLGIDLLWFGVFAVLMGELAIITPPIGLLTFIIYGLTKDPAINLGHKISLKDVFVAVGWFMPTAVVLVVILILFPEIVTWLPSLMAT